MSAPFRARNMVLVNVSRSARLSAISFGVIVLSAQRFQNGGAGVSWCHRSIRADVFVDACFLPPGLCLHPENHRRCIARFCFVEQCPTDGSVGLSLGMVKLLAVIFAQSLWVDANNFSYGFRSEERRVGKECR